MAQQQNVHPIHPVLQHLNKRADPADLPRAIADIVVPVVEESTDDVQIDSAPAIGDAEPKDALNAESAPPILSKPVTAKLRPDVQFGLRSGI